MCERQKKALVYIYNLCKYIKYFYMSLVITSHYEIKKKQNESLALLYLSLLYADDTATSVLNINNGHS